MSELREVLDFVPDEALGVSRRRLAALYFVAVSNAEEVLAWILRSPAPQKPEETQGSRRPQVCALDASTLCGVFQVQVAASGALLAEARGSMQTRSISAEIVVSLSGGRQISLAFRQFGLSAASERILLVLVDPSEEFVASMRRLVRGRECDVSQLEADTEASKVMAAYRIAPEELSFFRGPDGMDAPGRKVLLETVLGRMALRLL